MNSFVRIILSINLIALSIGCFNDSKKPDDYIKKEIARSGDRQLDKASVQLYKKNFYYIGYKEGDDKDEYYLAFSLKQDKYYKICRIFANGGWDKSDTINHLIISASKKLDSLDLEFDTIYDDTDSVNISLLDSKNYSINSSYLLKNIYEINNLNKYVLRKCFSGSKCPRF